MGGAEGKAGRGLATARVVVGPAGDHHLGAVAQRALRQAGFLQVVEPDRARHRTLAVAQLEVGLDLAAADPRHLADQQDPRPFAQLLLKLAGVATDREGTRKVRPRRPARTSWRYRLLPHRVEATRSASSVVPKTQLTNRRTQLDALLGQRVGDADRGPRLDLALDDALVLELAKALGEETIGKSRHGLCKLAEAHRPLGQGADDRPGPSLADQLDGGVEMWADSLDSLVLRGGCSSHSKTSLLNVSDGVGRGTRPSLPGALY